MEGSRWTSRETLPGFIDLACALLILGIPGRLFPWRSTQNDPDVLDSSSQIGEHGRACAKSGPGRSYMTIKMPASDHAVLNRRDAIVAALRAIVPGEGVIDSSAEMVPYESDGLMAYRQPPMVVVLPDTTEQVSQVLKYCFEQGIK